MFCPFLTFLMVELLVYVLGVPLSIFIWYIIYKAQLLHSIFWTYRAVISRLSLTGLRVPSNFGNTVYLVLAAKKRDHCNHGITVKVKVVTCYFTLVEHGSVPGRHQRS
jgi:hypothetical protein